MIAKSSEKKTEQYLDSRPVKNTTGTVTLRSMHHDIFSRFVQGSICLSACRHGLRGL